MSRRVERDLTAPPDRSVLWVGRVGSQAVEVSARLWYDARREVARLLEVEEQSQQLIVQLAPPPGELLGVSPHTAAHRAVDEPAPAPASTRTRRRRRRQNDPARGSDR